MKRAGLYFLTLLMLTACAAASKEKLKSTAAQKYKFEVTKNYQEVYRHIAERGRECWETGYLFSPQAQNIIDADLYSDLGEAEVSWRMVNFGNSYYATAIIQRIDNNKTQVTVLNSLKSWDDIGKKIEKWVTKPQEKGC
ncbi:MAG: hypothetical protein IPH06_12700 [Alphaproteobacteria bacterium]|nr:hypothetical protein [Alphaproteobacteria bacterium]QQS56324.1 MAG: hypothetical protein IPN28_08455 [Alphaproteobacteria bacterium]